MSFTSCSETGDQVLYSVKVCESRDCSADCTTYKMAYPTCDSSTGTQVSCSSSVDSYKQFKELNYHYEYNILFHF